MDGLGTIPRRYMFCVNYLEYLNPIVQNLLLWRIKQNLRDRCRAFFVKKSLQLPRKFMELLKKAPNTPLRPHILAAFLPWGGFAGAGRPAPPQMYSILRIFYAL